MNYQKIRADIQALNKKKYELDAQIRAAGREPNSKEMVIMDEIDVAIESLQKALPENPVTWGGNHNLMNRGRSYGGFSSAGEFFSAVVQAGLPSGQKDPRLYNAATGLSETISSDGGFLLQPTLSQEILQNAFEYGALAKLCRRQPIGSNSNGIKIPGVDETSRATGSRFGGVRSYWLDEAALKTASKPKFRQIELNLKKNVVLIYSTDELLQDAAALDGFIRDAAPKEIAFSVDDAIINGTGAGQPLGVLNAGCLVTVDKEAGQAADTIVAENILKMVKRTLGKTSNYKWVYNKSVLDQIYSLSLAVGTGGIPLFMAAGSLPNQPENRLLGIPMVECEQCATVGDLGDIILADFGNGYILADKGGVQADVSIHVQFVYDESVFRFVYRVDGQPAMASAVTPYKGGAGNTQSHFIALAERA